MSRHILVINDDQRTAQRLERLLTDAGYQVTLALDGRAGLQAARAQPPDLVILDWLYPPIDGLRVCQLLRLTLSSPILMLTAKGQVVDRIAGLEAGADAYLVKPCAVDELLARLRALYRRAMPDCPSEVLRFADVMLDTGLHQ